MRVSEARHSRWQIGSPSTTLAALLVVALALCFAPSWFSQALRDGWREALRPGLKVLTAATDWSSASWNEFRSPDRVRLAAADQMISDLNDQVQRLEMQLLLAGSDRERGQTDLEAGRISGPSLLLTQPVVARVLGRQAQAFLQTHDLLDVGRSQGIANRALVIDDASAAAPPALVDQGRDAHVEPGRWVLSGSRVWGKIAQVGPHTSTVQRVTDSGYRELVQLATRRDGRLHFAARGVLVGMGQSLCKIDLVETTQPVTVGDLVFTADDGVLDAPLLYGRVARVERKPGAAHWQIWMEPAVAANSPPARVAVLRMEFNSARLASQAGGGP